VTSDELLAIQKLVVEPVDRANREATEEIKKLLADHVIEQNSRLADHEQRIKTLEGVKAKALFVWSLVVMVATLLGRYTWENLIKPLVGQR